MRRKLKGFRDYDDYLSYAKVCVDLSDKENRALYNYLIRHQSQVDPTLKIRELNKKSWDYTVPGALAVKKCLNLSDLMSA